MAIALFLQAIQALMGSQFVTDKLKRNEHVIRVLKQVGLDPEHPPEDFEGVYGYALVEYGVGKPDACLEIFRAQEIRDGFRRSFDGNDPQGWLTIGEAFLASSEIGEKVRSAGCEPKRELAEFAAAFMKVARRSQTPKETLVQHQLRKIERTIDRKLEQVSERLESIANPAALSPGETLALASANCRAGALAVRMRSWFEVLGYRLELSQKWEAEYFEWVINIPKRRGFDRVLVRGIAGEAGIRDVMGLRESVALQRVDEGWLVTARRISKAARSEVEKAENGDLFCFTFDEFLDQDADFEGYLDWLEAEIATRGIEARYVPLACMKEEFDPSSHQRLGMSRYGESDGWTEGYIDLWLDDPAKEHLSILGEFGTGKTWLALHYASIAVSKYRSAKANGVERPRLPIVIPLRDYAKAVSVESLFSEFFFRKHEIPIPGYSAFEELNRMGKLLLIFDGFDEMAARVDKQQMINNFWELAKVVVPGSKVILTCRTEHFPDAKEGRSLLNAELQASTRSLSGETPQFEVLELEKFDDSQIREVLLLASSSETVEQVMGNPQLLDLARRPVMTELILEALPDIEAGKPVDMSRVYLYAVKRKMERDIKAERTFTSMADKLYFLCELSWEMLSNDRMSLNYREFPDRIRKLFGAAVQEEKDLDHWHYDMMGQTMLIRNSDGDYQPAHRSLLEFFVAFKFAAELGALAPDFLELAQMKSGIDRTLEPRDYTWSEYFGGGAVAPLKGFVTEKLEVLRSGFGKEILPKAVIDLILPNLQREDSMILSVFKQLINSTAHQSDKTAGYLGCNSVNLMIGINPYSLIGLNLASSNLVSSNLTSAILQNTDLSYANLTHTQFARAMSTVLIGEISPDNRLVATGEASGDIRLWSIQDGNPVQILRGHIDWVRTISFNPDGLQMISGSDDGTVRLWCLRTGKCLEIIDRNNYRFYAVKIDPTGKFLATGERGNLKIWNLQLRQLIWEADAHSKRINSIQFNIDFDALISAGYDSKIRVWSIKDGSCLKVIDAKQGHINAIVFSKSNNCIFSAGSTATIKCWDYDTGLCLYILNGHGCKINSLSITQDEKHIVSADDNGIINVWDLDTQQCIHKIEDESKNINSVRLSADSKLMVIANNSRNISIHHMSSHEIIREIKGCNDLIYTTAFSRNHDFLVSGGEEQIIKIWNIKSGELHARLSGHRGLIWTVAISSDNRLVASCSADHTVRLWSIEEQKNIHIMTGHSSRVYHVDFNRDASLLVSGSDDTTVRIWDVKTGSCLKIFNAHADKVWTVKFSPCGNIFASAGLDGNIFVWDVITEECLRQISTPYSVNYVLFSHDGKYLISADDNSSVKIWNIETGLLWKELNGHNGRVHALDLSKDGRILVSSGNDKTIRIWDLHSGDCIRVIDDFLRSIPTVCITQDGKQVAGSSFDETIQVWDVDTGQCIGSFNDRPYEGMNITGVKGLTPGTIATLKALGAVEDEEVRGEKLE